MDGLSYDAESLAVELQRTSKTPTPKGAKTRRTMNSRIKMTIAILTVAGSIASIVGLYFLFNPDLPPPSDQRVQVHTGSGDNIQAARDVHIHQGVPETLVKEWTRVASDQTTQLEQLQRDFLDLRNDIRERSTREAELLEVLDDMDRGDIRSAEERLGRVLDREVRINLFADAAQTADMIGRLRALQLDWEGAAIYERRASELSASVEPHRPVRHRQSAYVFQGVSDPITSFGSASTTVKTVSERMLSALESQRAAMESDPAKIYDLVDEILVPHSISRRSPGPPSAGPGARRAQPNSRP